MATSAVSLVASSHADARATGRSEPPGRAATISAAINEMRLPGRSTQARTFTGATGIAPRMSIVTRPMRNARVGGEFLDELGHQGQWRRAVLDLGIPVASGVVGGLEDLGIAVGASRR